MIEKRIRFRATLPFASAFSFSFSFKNLTPCYAVANATPARWLELARWTSSATTKNWGDLKRDRDDFTDLRKMLSSRCGVQSLNFIKNIIKEN